ncbi:TPA: Lrp/AsnC ligand binding domain-containing protein [archaeon]|jgi:anthranilate phosphoribosyltransferase|uniref:Lrp/AsnC ligand binding domain-containing protein n=1 Tax=Candidatus Undinarchaeum marinum TaxID=2756141 RepID=A0A832UXS2_9ARCH|nr:Lrp/AsnC ligand binding domain-containing protein [Candidatus Undinarchaeum marinum]HIK01680.1 Lrp/AsnC ligand binding domain-containing protein [Candidatus Undinarchaeales archaeon SRR5007147.bin71]
MVNAFILIMSKTGTERSVIRELSKLEEVVDVSVVYGDYDIIAKIQAETLEDLNSVILDKIRALDEVSNTSTLIAV